MKWWWRKESESEPALTDAALADQAVLDELFDRFDGAYRRPNSLDACGARFDELDRIGEWAATLPDRSLRAAYARWVAFYRRKTQERVVELRAVEFRQHMPKPPVAHGKPEVMS